jgi:hypothetical protein
MLGNATPWYLDAKFLPAAFGLIGVIVGGLITAGSCYLLDERRSKREREREERNRLTEIKRAARMIDLDLLTAAGHATFAHKNNRYWGPGDSPLKLKGWDDYAAILAPAASTDVWSKIRLGINAVRHLNEYRALDASTSDEECFPPLSNTLKSDMERILNNITNARGALTSLWKESDAP